MHDKMIKWGLFPDQIGICNLQYVGFGGQGKTSVPGEKPLKARTRTNNKLNPHMMQSLGIKPTLVGGKCSHHCAIFIPPELFEPIERSFYGYFWMKIKFSGLTLDINMRTPCTCTGRVNQAAVAHVQSTLKEFTFSLSQFDKV